MSAPGSLIINSPYTCPQRHWNHQEDRTLEMVEARRPASYEIYDIRNNTRRVEELQLVSEIRARVAQWREMDYPGVTSVTRRLLLLPRSNWGHSQ